MVRASFTAASAHAEKTYRVLFGAVAITLSSMVVYITVRLSTVVADGYTPAEAVLAAMLLSAEFFLMFHGVGYFWSAVKASRRDATAKPDIFAKPASVPVAVLVAAFNESEDVIDETLAAIRAMDYPNINLFLLDDSTRDDCREAAHRLAARYNAHLRLRVDRAGYKAGAINDVLPELTEKYVAILDADQRPVQAWLKDVIPMLEANDKLAMVQAPQVYVNLEGLPVAQAARFQQAIFFEYICEGKAYSNAIYCCGSNVVLRRDALMSVEVVVDGRRHFFDETSVTEDFATSVRLHAKGWQTDYVNQPYVLGMGPETLPAYFTQHMRWSMGSLGVGLRVLRMLFKSPRMLTPAQWWEYLLSGTYYFVGFANLIFMAAPVAFILGGIRPLHTDTDLYLMFFIPYILFTMNLFFFGMKLRHYPIRGIWLASALSFSTTWTYARAGIVALFGLKRAFAVTPKGVGSGAVPLRRMPAELILFSLNACASLVGIYHLMFVELDVSYVVTTIWATYHAVLMSTLLFYFNRPVRIAHGPLVFARASLAA
jgi:cellulose synthase (UDP-forming)